MVVPHRYSTLLWSERGHDLERDHELQGDGRNGMATAKVVDR